jgi:hypothetical protein
LSVANLGILKILLYPCQERLFIAEEQLDKEIISPSPFYLTDNLSSKYYKQSHQLGTAYVANSFILLRRLPHPTKC